MLTAEQLRAARALLRIEQAELAVQSGVSLASIKRFEAMDGLIKGRTETLESLLAALGALGVIFIPSNGEDVGVRLRKRPDKAPSGELKSSTGTKAAPAAGKAHQRRPGARPKR